MPSSERRGVISGAANQNAARAFRQFLGSFPEPWRHAQARVEQLQQALRSFVLISLCFASTSDHAGGMARLERTSCSRLQQSLVQALLILWWCQLNHIVECPGWSRAAAAGAGNVQSAVVRSLLVLLVIFLTVVVAHTGWRRTATAGADKFCDLLHPGSCWAPSGPASWPALPILW